MILTAPMPFHEALHAAEVRSLLPTTGNSAALRALEADIKRRSWMSATVTSAKHLALIRDVTNGISTGQLDQASARLQIKQLLASTGYAPSEEHAGGLQDLGSDARTNLQIETNVQTAQGYGWFKQGMQADVLDAFPAQELYRALTPKGSERDWPSRWLKVGGEFYGSRMIALKTDLVWDKLGSSALFDDGLDNPWPPFAFNSGMDVRDIGRAEAEQLGLLDASTSLLPRATDFSADLDATPVLRETWLHDAITESGLGRFIDGVLHFNIGGAS